jgi:protein-disulfide isomerase
MLAARDAAPSLGRREAPVTITEFADFQCPYCRAAQKSIKQIVSDYGDDVRLVFKHLPLENHTGALPAARAAYCAGRQGSFWQYHDALFASDDFTTQTFKNIASELKLNLSEFDACFASAATRAAISEDLREAQRLGISGTPTFIINGRLVRGAQSPADFKAIIERELQSARAAAHQQ